MEIVPLLLIVGAAIVFGVKTAGGTARFDLLAFGLMLMALFQLYYLVT